MMEVVKGGMLMLKPVGMFGVCIMAGQSHFSSGPVKDFIQVLLDALGFHRLLGFGK